MSNDNKLKNYHLTNNAVNPQIYYEPPIDLNVNNYYYENLPFSNFENPINADVNKQFPPGNQESLSQPVISRPLSEKDIDKEVKRRKQEEYRKILDMQLQEANERKKRNQFDNSPCVANEYNRKDNAYFPSKRDNDAIEKEKERQKKLEYQNILKQQIEEKKNKKEMEKKKKHEDELKYEVKYQLDPPVTRGKRIERSSKTESTVIGNNPSTPATVTLNPQTPTTDNTINYNNNSPQNEEYNTYKDNATRNNLNNANPQQEMIMQGDPNTNIYVNVPQAQIPYNNNLINSYTNDPGSRTGFYPTQYGMPPFFEEMLRYFFQEQMKIISQYKTTVDKLSEERDKAMYQNIANREKIVALRQLKMDQEKIKKNLGFYPFDSNYNKKIEDMFNSLIENKTENENSIVKEPNYAETNVMNNYPRMQLTTNMGGSINNIKSGCANTINDADLDFRSKYEDLKQSMMSFHFKNDDEEEDPQMKASLQGFSKLVKIDEVKPSMEGDFLQTWRVGEGNTGENIPKSKFAVNNSSNMPKQRHLHDTIIQESNNFDKSLSNSNDPDLEYNKQHMKYIQEKSKSMNNPLPLKKATVSTANFNFGSSNTASQKEIVHKLTISKEDKEKSLIFEESLHHQNDDTNPMMNNNTNMFEEDHHYYCNPDYYRENEEEIEEQRIMNEDKEEVQDDEETEKQYEDTFNNDKELENIEKNTQKQETQNINLEDYKDIHESQKFQSQVNFFEESNIANIIIPNSRKHVINPNCIPDGNDPVSECRQINQLYDKYQIRSNNVCFNEDFNINQNDDNDFMESLNKFNTNFRPVSAKNAKDQNSITKHNVRLPPLSAKPQNAPSKQIMNENEDEVYNPMSEINNDDSILNNLAKFRKLALNEINESDMSILKNNKNSPNRRQVDLIPKDVLKKFNKNLISSGSNRNDIYQKDYK